MREKGKQCLVMTQGGSRGEQGLTSKRTAVDVGIDRGEVIVQMSRPGMGHGARKMRKGSRWIERQMGKQPELRRA